MVSRASLFSAVCLMFSCLILYACAAPFQESNRFLTAKRSFDRPSSAEQWRPCPPGEKASEDMECFDDLIRMYLYLMNRRERKNF